MTVQTQHSEEQSSNCLLPTPAIDQLFDGTGYFTGSDRDTDTRTDIESEEELELESASLNPFSTLDALLAESEKRVDQAAQVRAARKALAKGQLATDDRIAIEATVRKWELEREWWAKANVIMFEVQHCDHCGSLNRHFTGFFQRQEHRTSKIMRWLCSAQVAVHLNLPKEAKEVVIAVPICDHCASHAGWILPEQPVLELQS